MYASPTTPNLKTVKSKHTSSCTKVSRKTPGIFHSPHRDVKILYEMAHNGFQPKKPLTCYAICVPLHKKTKVYYQTFTYAIHVFTSTKALLELWPFFLSFFLSFFPSITHMFLSSQDPLESYDQLCFKIHKIIMKPCTV